MSIQKNSEKKKGEFIFQSENESNDEDYAHSPVLLDLDENSKQQQQKAASREASSPNSAPIVNQQNQGLASGMHTRYLISQNTNKIIHPYYVSIKYLPIITSKA